MTFAVFAHKMSKNMLAYVVILIKVVASARLLTDHGSKCRTSEVKPDIFSNVSQIVYPAYSYAECSHITFTTGYILKISSNSTNLKYILFKNSNISVVPTSVFNQFSNVTQLYLNNSGIHTIHPGAFRGLTALEMLHLENNIISKIERGIFNSLTNLRILDISNNEIKSIAKYAFLNLFLLKSLNVSHNKLRILEPIIFKNLKAIGYLDLSHNHLFEISPTLFTYISESVHDLQLDISNNYLYIIDFSYFPKSVSNLYLSDNVIVSVENLIVLLNIEVLDLSNNRIPNINILNDNLKFLNLSYNSISSLDVSLFNRSYNLQILDLSHNFLKVLSENIFEDLFNLTNLYLQNNHIIKIPIGCFRNVYELQILNLSNNEIEVIDYDAFPGLQSLVTLDISNNKLSYLSESAFEFLPNLESLYISNNFLTTFNATELLQYTKMLRSVDLDNNLWYCNSLQKIIHNLQKSNITIFQGSIKKTRNLLGIGCLVDVSMSDNHNEILIEVLKELRLIKKAMTEQQVKSVSNKYYKTNSINNIGTIFQKEFVNSLFHKYLNGEFVNDTFFKELNNTIVDFSNEIFNLDTILNLYLDNSSVFYKLTSNFSELFEKHFNGSDLYDYFKNDFFDSTLFKYINTSTTIIKASSIINSNKDFTLHQLFQEIVNSSKQLVSENNTSSETSKFVDPYLVKQVVNKFTELQNAIVVLTIIVISTLVLQLVSIALRNKQNVCVCSIKDDVKKNIANKTENTGEVELI